MCVLISNPSEPYIPYDVEIIPVTWVMGQGEITRQTVFTQEGGKFTGKQCIVIHPTITLQYTYTVRNACRSLFFVLKEIFQLALVPGLLQGSYEANKSHQNFLQLQKKGIMTSMSQLNLNTVTVTLIMTSMSQLNLNTVTVTLTALFYCSSQCCTNGCRSETNYCDHCNFKLESTITGAKQRVFDNIQSDLQEHTKRKLSTS